MKKFIILVFLAILFFFKSGLVIAADFTSDYRVEYNLQNDGNKISSNVNFHVQITHLRSDIFVKKFSLSFPSAFPIKSLQARDDTGEVQPQIIENGSLIKIDLEFTKPNTGKGSVNNLFINFTQDNLFQINGNVWEVILPTITNRDQGTYQVIVNLPENTDKKISISKPRVDQINGKQLIWNNPQTKTIYAVFGDKQIYHVNLIYDLENPKIVPVYTDIAFPPDTLYQQVIINRITPLPEKVFLDSDGNYLARYILKPKESKNINFDGVINVSTKPRLDYRLILDQQLQQQKSYLLTARDYWRLSSVDRYRTLSTVSDIYNFIVNSFTYDFKKVTSSSGRLGAEKALLNPDQAVCTEFTDAFVALAREKGIFSREMEGYGFSFDSQLRPVSLTSDLLHAWPEFYDPKLKIWIPLDPTWENTSGIDYFSSFDLNHIVFAIHGKDPRYPYPAGTYKTSNSKNILIEPVADSPKIKQAVNLQVKDITKTISQEKKYQFNINVDNQSNIFLYNQKIVIESSPELLINPKEITISQLAPLAKQEFTIDYSAKKNLSKTNSYIRVVYNNREITRQSLTILPYYYDLVIKFSYLSLGLLIFSLVIFYAKKRRR
jgi:transglutaminase-like putative cysteine protease